MSIPAAFRALVDDAAVFPPGSAALEDAVRLHAGYRTAPFADLVGPLVVGTDLLPRLVDLTSADLTRDDSTRDAEPLRLSLVVPSAAQVPDAVTLVAAAPALEVAALEVKLDPAAPAVDQVAALAAHRADLVGSGSLRPDADVYVEVPRPPDGDTAAWDALLDAVRDNGFRLKFRTGGVSAEMFPSEREVARWVVAATTRGVPFKCTAGLHNAVRHTGHGTGFEHHGYLNVLLAAVRAAAGAGLAEVEAALADRDAQHLASQVSAASPQTLAAARTSFASYGSCSVLEPLHDLAGLGLVAPDLSPQPVEETR